MSNIEQGMVNAEGSLCASVPVEPSLKKQSQFPAFGRKHEARSYKPILSNAEGSKTN